MDNDKRSKLYLIRHGETVDNVKGLYAGVRDSALTVHGVQQTQKLGNWLAQHKPPLTHCFSSDLIRALKTAEAICTAQPGEARLKPTQLKVLQEQNFGPLEGQPWTSKTRARSTTGSDEGTKEVGTLHAETKEAMAARADTFICSSLVPILQALLAGEQVHVAVVSHGMMLSTLWKQILKRQAPGTVRVQEKLLERLQPIALEHLGGWSNTGFLELEIGSKPCETALPSTYQTAEETEVVGETRLLEVMAVNHREHLVGLKRARGGIGSSAHDDHQSSIKSFFPKKARHE